MDDLLVIEERIDDEVHALDTCQYAPIILAEILSRVQKAVDDLSLHSYSNLPQWVAKLDQEVCLSRQCRRTLYYYRVNPKVFNSGISNCNIYKSMEDL